jgi:AcrR family transcriptional regulator
MRLQYHRECGLRHVSVGAVHPVDPADAQVGSGGWAEPDSVRDRLIRAGDEWLHRHGVGQLSIGAVAEAAGVSRATAFRKLGGRDQLVVAIALARGDRFARECSAQMAARVGAFAKLEAAFLYLVGELPNDPIIRELFALRSPDDLGPEADALATATLGTVIEAGQAAGEVRDDMPTSDIVHWTVEQLYLAVVQADRSPAAVVKRVRTFLTPALSARRDHELSGSIHSRIQSLEFALEHAREALSALQGLLPADAPGLVQ